MIVAVWANFDDLFRGKWWYRERTQDAKMIEREPHPPSLVPRRWEGHLIEIHPTSDRGGSNLTQLKLGALFIDGLLGLVSLCFDPFAHHPCHISLQRTGSWFFYRGLSRR